MTTASRVTWKPHALPQLGVRFDRIADAEPQQGVEGTMRYFVQARQPVQIALWAGPGQDLATWRSRFHPGTEFSGERRVTICGQAAIVQEARQAASEATGLVPEADGSLHHIQAQVPAQIHIVVAFSQRQQPVLMSWAIHPDVREVWRAEEQHFFASIVCE